jgi:hypothetical protein
MKRHSARCHTISIFGSALLLLFLLAGCGSRIEAAQTRSVSDHVGEIHGDKTVGQTFVAQHDGLQSVDVLVATYARRNTHPVTFHLRSDPQSDTDLRTVTVSAAEVADNQYQRFSFDPIRDSHSKRYYFFIASPDSESGDAITAWLGPPDGYREGSLYIKGEAEEGQLAFQLGYNRCQILQGLLIDALSSTPAILATLALFVLPGLALLVWFMPVWHWDALTALIVASGLSAALFPLLLLFSRPLGLRWNSTLVWLFLFICLLLIVWRLRRAQMTSRIRRFLSGWRERFRWPALETWLLAAVVAMVLIVRWIVVRPLSVPLWGDSHQHTYIAQLIVEKGGLFDSWEPYSPYTSLTVHFGFHATVAFFHWVTGKDLLRSVILVGQVFNALAVLALYPLALRIAGSDRPRIDVRWAGIAALLVAGLVMPMPMEYVNWGRYPQLAGQMILLVALWLFWVAAEYQGARSWAVPVLAAIAAAGMALSYYRMPYYYAAFVLAWLLLYGLMTWRGAKERWQALAKRLLLLGSVALALVLPWGSNLLGGRLAAAVVEGAAVAAPIEGVLAEYRTWLDIDQYVPVIVGVLALIAFFWALARRHWAVSMLGLWTAILASLVAARLVHLPGASHMQSFAILIALYMPAGLLVGWLAGRLAGWMVARGRRWGSTAMALLLLIVAVLGFGQRMAVIDSGFMLVNRADEVAMDWVAANTPPDAVFLVNGFLIYGGRLAAGSDAGWWIPYLAGRDNTMPPQYAMFNEAEADPGYGKALVQLVADLGEHTPTTPEGLKQICAAGVTHVYVGQGQGKIAQEPLQPFLNPADLVSSPYFELLYHQDRVWVFSLRGDACS